MFPHGNVRARWNVLRALDRVSETARACSNHISQRGHQLRATRTAAGPATSQGSSTTTAYKQCAEKQRSGVTGANAAAAFLPHPLKPPSPCTVVRVSLRRSSNRRNRSALPRQPRQIRHLQEQPAQAHQQAESIRAYVRILGHDHYRIEKAIHIVLRKVAR